MNFKTIIIIFILHSTAAFANAVPDVHPFPLGVIIRQKFLDQIIDNYNHNRSVQIQRCIDNWQLNAKIDAPISDLSWQAIENKELIVNLEVQKIQIDGHFVPNCQNPDVSKAVDFHISSNASLPLKIWLTPKTLSVRIDDLSLAALTKNLKFDSKNAPHISQILNNSEIKEALMQLVGTSLNNQLSQWARERLRGLVYYGESIKSLFAKSDVWKGGVQIEKGAIQLKNTASALEDKELAFAFYPRENGSLFMNQNQIEFYVNATFLTGEQIHKVLGDKNNLVKNQDLIEQLTKHMKDFPLSKDAEFKRPQIPHSNADVSLLLTQGLINEALRSIYQENLADFTTSINVGDQVKGLITKEDSNLSIRIELGSNKVPQLVFESNQLNLKVFDYFFRIGTWIEDRLIPSTEIQANVNISAGLKIDSPAQTVNLLVSPDTFNIKFSEQGKFERKLTSKDLELLENIANQIWRTFFKNYPELILFPTVFETSKLQLHIQDIEVQNEMILLHMNLDESNIHL